MTRLLLASALLAPASAFAATFTLHPFPLLTAQTGSYYENGLGSPTVAYIPNGGAASTGAYVMFFETKISTSWLAARRPDLDYSTCKGGVAWGIGMAVSEDGLNSWNVVGNEPLLLPEPGTYYGCVAAHPKVAYDSAAGVLNVFFKAEQAGPTTTANQQTGVGVLQVRRTGSWASINGWETAAFAEPVLALANFGYPSVVQHQNTWYLWLAQVPNIYLASFGGSLGNAFTNPNATPTFSILPSPIIEPGATTWTPSRVYNPATVCRNDSATPFSMFVGGKDVTTGGALNAGGWGQAQSSDGQNWFTAANPEFTWTSTNDWRHWDALLVKLPGTCDTGPFDEDFLIYNATADANGKNQIGFAYTSSTWNEGYTRQKLCSSSAADYDFTPGEITRPAELPVEEAVGGIDAEEYEASACSSIPGRAGFAFLLAPLAMLVRRRR